MIVMAKGLGNGLAIGAVVAGPVVESPPNLHLSTFGGNPIRRRAPWRTWITSG